MTDNSARPKFTEDSSSSRRRSRDRSRRSRSRERRSRDRGGDSDDQQQERKRKKRVSAWDSVQAPPGMFPPEVALASAIQASLSAAKSATSTTPAVSADYSLCQIYVGNLFFGIMEEEIRTAFEQCGKVKNIQMMKDPDSHKAYCFLDYETPQEAELALKNMNDFFLAGRKIRVGRPMNPAPLKTPGAPAAPTTMQVPGMLPAMLQADDSVAQEFGLPIVTGVKWGKPGEPTPPRDYPLKAEAKVYACGLTAEVTSEAVRSVFQKSGIIRAVVVSKQGDQHYAIVEFTADQYAEDAVRKFNGMPLEKFSGKSSSSSSSTSGAIKVGRVLPAPMSPAQLMGMLASASAAASNPAQLPESIEDRTLLSGGSQRMTLMQKLMRSEETNTFKNTLKQYEKMTKTQVPVGPAPTFPSVTPNFPMLPPQVAAVAQAAAAAAATAALEPFISPLGGSIGLSMVPTRCIVLKNLVGSPDEVDDSFGDEIKEECAKFGKVDHLLIYDSPNPMTGAVEVSVFVFYSVVESAMRAVSRMHNRYFAKRRISCGYFDEPTFIRLMEA